MQNLIFFLLTAVALAELALTAFLVNDYETRVGGYPSLQYRALVLFILGDACWTALFGLAYVCFVAAGALSHLAAMAASLVWLLVTAVLWGVAAGFYSTPSQGGRGGGMCWNDPVLSRCRQTQTVEALAWTAFALCILTMFVSCFSWRTKRAPAMTTRRAYPVV